MGAQAASSTATAVGSAGGVHDFRSPSSLELVSSFIPAVSGSVRSLRYWNPAESVGSAVGSIRSGDGTLLATVSSPSGSYPRGWQILTFGKPVAVVAAHRYAVTVLPAPTSDAAAHRSSRWRAPVTSPDRWPSDFARSAPALASGGLSARVQVVFTPGPALISTQTQPPTPSPDTGAAQAPPAVPSPTPTSSGSPTRAAAPTPTAKTTTPAATAAPVVPGPAAAGWPTAANTGVPAGTNLTPSGPLTITDAGAVVDGLLVDGSITVRANNVTIRNTKIVGGGIDNGNGEVAGTLIQDVEIDGGSDSGFLAGISYSGFTVMRANIHHVGVGVHANSDVVMQDSYVHDIVVEGDPANGGSHNEAFLSNGGTNITVTNNRLSSGDEPNVSSALSLYGDFGRIDNVLVQGNLFNGGGYCVYGGSVPGKPYPIATNTRFIANTFGREMSPGCGGYGPAIDFRPGGGNVWTGNVWVDGGAVTP
jgi:hypothetical protein